MATALSRATPVLPSADHHEITVRAQIQPAAEKSFRPTNGLLAMSEGPAWVTAVTTLSTVLSRISGSPQVSFGPYLRDLSDDLGRSFGRSGGPELSRTVADATLPIGTAVTLRLIADLLVTNAFAYAFPRGRGGRIAVSFAACPEAWELAVEDSGIALRAHGDPRDNALILARLLVSQLDGQLEFPEVAGGTRCLVTVPRPAGG